MPGFEQGFSDEASADGGYLGQYRAAVERLRGETVAELGFQPMPPEKFAMIATTLAALPLVALMLPAIPVEPLGWGVGLALLAVWLTAVRVQACRWDRFQAHWHRKILAHGEAESLSPAAPATRRSHAKAGQSALPTTSRKAPEWLTTR